MEGYRKCNAVRLHRREIGSGPRLSVSRSPRAQPPGRDADGALLLAFQFCPLQSCEPVGGAVGKPGLSGECPFFNLITRRSHSAKAGSTRWYLARVLGAKGGRCSPATHSPTMVRVGLG